ncbi:hypothetical protein [Kitasatospora sp. NPDC005856]|uniref:hypothetical protein n=1 Tax=Kitasatospora sp. NPDC005856 TaxID=3154566 RepID=UPI0033EF0D44
MRIRLDSRARVRVVAAALLVAAATAQAATQAQAQPTAQVQAQAQRQAQDQDLAQAPRPGMLTTADLPPDPLTWQGHASDQPGDSFETRCLAGWYRPDVPEENIWTADFFTSETAAAYERVYVLPTEAEAIALADSARLHYAGCAGRMQADYPHDVVTAQDHGTVDVEEGATVGGVHEQEVPAWQGYRNVLYGVGRDGNTVAIVEWESNSTQPDVPAFKETVRAAVNKLH